MLRLIRRRVVRAARVTPLTTSRCGYAASAVRRVANDAVSKFDFMWAQNDKMDYSLYEDPTGGLSISEATELSERELGSEMTASLNAYDPVAYVVAFTPVVDMVDLLARNHLLPPVRPEVVISSWFHDPRATVTKAEQLEVLMGRELYDPFAILLRQWLDDVEPMLPLSRVLKRYNIGAESQVMWRTFLRVVGSNLWSRSWETKATRTQQLPGIALALCSGKGEALAPVAPVSGKLSNEELHARSALRIQFVAEMLIALGQETGNSTPAFLGIQLMRANNLDVPYRTQKALTNVFASIQRLKTEWDLRSSGQLRQVIPRWLSKYLKQAHKDAMSSRVDVFLGPTSELTSPHTTSAHGEHKLDGLCAYFQRVANSEVAEMQENIARSLQGRQEANRQEEERAEKQSAMPDAGGDKAPKKQRKRRAKPAASALANSPAS